MAKCDCIKKDEEKIKNYFLENEKAESVENVSFENEAFMMSGGTQLYSEVLVKYTERNRKGELKSKKKKVNMTYNFCPLCGKSYTD